MKKIVFCIITFVLAITTLQFASATHNALHDTLIALDAGHGGNDLGAQYPATCADDGDASGCLVFEKDVNLAVAEALSAKLLDAGAIVVFTDRVSSRKARVDSALEKCEAAAGRKCDVLLSVHHNGNVDSAHDGTLVIYTQKSDFPLATALHDALIAGLELPDEGFIKGGYGMTVHGNTVSALTEGYYITNDCEAELYLYQTTITPSCDKTLYPDGDRVDQEAQILFGGLEDYFVAQAADPGLGGGNGKGKGPNK